MVNPFLQYVFEEISMSCIFCQIANGDIFTEFLYEDDKVVAFRDLHPQAPTHVLIVPKKHIESMVELNAKDIPLTGHMLDVARRLAEKEGIAQGGYRLVINTGPDGGQVVMHLHLHLIGGRVLPEQMK